MRNNHSIADIIIDFVNIELPIQGRTSFRLSDLTAYVRGVSGKSYSPESTGRVLRKLRQTRTLDYAVIGNGAAYVVR